MAEPQQFDCIIIGAGPGGYVAAIRAAQLGLKVAIIEEQHMGGVCLNWGCIPTKALLRSAEILTYFKEADTFGLKVEKADFDLKKIVQRSRDVSQKLNQGIQHLMKKNKIITFNGRAHFLSKNSQDKHLCEVTLKDNKEKIILEANSIVIATGAHARQLPHLKVDGKFIWTSKEAMVPEVLPKKMAILGSGAIGIEYACFYNALGVDVTVIELQDRILPAEDLEVANYAAKSFSQTGIKILTSSTIEKADPKKDSLEITIKTGQESQILTVDKLIVAIGVTGNTQKLGLEHTKVQVDQTKIIINEYCQTHEPGVYAIGDVAGGPWLAHKASHEGIIVAEKIAGLHVYPLKKNAVAGCTYSMPQIASIGLNEEKAKQQGLSVKIGRFPFHGNGKAIAMGETEGFIKVLFDAKSGELLGAHMIGTEVTELIQGFAIAMACEATEAELMHTIFPHPTLSEMMHEAVLNAYGRGIHI